MFSARSTIDTATPRAAKSLRNRLLSIAGALLASVLTGQVAQAEQPVLTKGAAIVTGFSGSAPAAVPAPSGDPADSLFIDLNGASMRLQDLNSNGQPPQGQLLAAPTTFQAKAGDVGQVFGVAIDDGRGPDGNLAGTPDIYLSATSAFGLQIVKPDASGTVARMRTGNPGAQWMAGQWGDAAKGGTPGSIWKVNGTTGEISLFADVKLGGIANAGPSLGNLTFHAKTRQIFVSDLSTGMIHRFDLHGVDVGYFDHGVQGRVSQGLAPVPDDPANRLDITNPLFNSDDAASWHYAKKGRMVWGLRAFGDRLYYATAEGPQVWSLSINADGTFGADPRMEIDVTGTPNGNAISDITFDGQGNMYLAQRGAARGDYAYKVFAEGKKSAVLRFHQDPLTQKWVPAPEEYAVGFPPDYRNTNGGVALGYGYAASGAMNKGACGQMVWTTGELLRQGSGLGGAEIVHGLQGMDRSLVRPANQPPSQSYFADYDGAFTDADVAGHMGDIEIWQPCEGVAALPLVPGSPVVPPPPKGRFNLTLNKYAAPHDCVAGGSGWRCSYRIFVTNTGTTTYYGPLTVDDALPAAPAGATMTFSPQPPWFCSASTSTSYQCIDPYVVLYPGQYTELDVVVDLPSSYQECYLTNFARIDWPLGYGDANPNDDTSWASAHIPGSWCKPPYGNKSNLEIKKYPYPGYQCVPYGTGWLCPYVVEVKNTGPAVYNDTIKVDDTVPAGVTALFNLPPGGVCVGGPPTYHCQLPTTLLNPGDSTYFLVGSLVPASYAKPGQCKVRNHVHITYAPGGSDENTNPADDDADADQTIPSKECIGDHTNLKIEKKFKQCVDGAPYHYNGQVCMYSIFVTNTGPGVYNGTITVDDLFTNPPDISVVGDPLANFNCSGPGANVQCTYPGATLLPGKTLELIALEGIPYGAIAPGKCTYQNTAKITQAVPGSNQNSNPNDDVSTATATISDPHCNRPPPPTETKLKIFKAAGDCVAKGNAGDYDCDYTISIKNIGTSKFSGKLEFDDKIDTKYGTASFDSAWSCTTGLQPWRCSMVTNLDPNTSVVAHETLHVSHGDLAVTSCAVKNTVTIVTPAGVVPPDNTASATAYMFNEPKCIQAPPPTPTPPVVIEGSDGHVSILKTCSPAPVGGAGIACKITVTNDGGKPLAGPVSFGDQGIWKGDNSPLSFASATPDSPDVTCSGLPATVVCTVPASALPPGGSHSVTVVIKQGNQTNYHNCAMVMDASRKTIGTPSCVDGGSEITVKKTGPATCQYDKDCTFQVSITNSGSSAYTGTLDLADLMAIGGKKATGAAITSITPPLGCTPAPATLPIACTANVSLAAGQTRMHTITVHMPPAAAGADGPVSGYNCFVGVGNAGSDAGIPLSAELSRDQSPGNGPGYSCVTFTMEQPNTCPGQLTRVGGDCKCPEGMNQGKNFTCLTNTRILPLPVPVPPVHTVDKCDPPRIGNKPNCYCPSDGDVFVRGRCLHPDTPPPACPVGQSKVDGVHCCPKGYTWDGKCYPPYTPPPVKECKFPMTGTWPNCHLVIQPCPEGTTGVYPFCKKIDPNQCKPGEVKVDGKHCCPRGSTWDGKCYPPSNTGNNNGGDNSPKCNGIKINGVCLGKPQNQFCKRGMKWNGKQCVSTDGPSNQQPNGPLQKSPGIGLPGIFKQLQLPGGLN